MNDGVMVGVLKSRLNGLGCNREGGQLIITFNASKILFAHYLSTLRCKSDFGGRGKAGGGGGC